MAEGSDNSKAPETNEATPNSDTASAHQSKSSSESFLEFSELEGMGEGKNAVFLVCRYCRCKVLRPGYGTLIEREVRK